MGQYSVEEYGTGVTYSESGSPEKDCFLVTPTYKVRCPLFVVK